MTYIIHPKYSKKEIKFSMKNYKMEAYFGGGLLGGVFWSSIGTITMILFALIITIIIITQPTTFNFAIMKSASALAVIYLIMVGAQGLHSIIVNLSMKKVTPDMVDDYRVFGNGIRRKRDWLFNSYNKKFYRESETFQHKIGFNEFLHSENVGSFRLPNIDGCNHDMDKRLNLALYFRDVTCMTEEEIILFKIEFDNYPIEIFQEYFKRKFMKNKFKKFLFKEIL